jgi:Protein of unknown function (DUF3592)
MKSWRWAIGFGVIGGIVIVADTGSLSGAWARVASILGQMSSTLLFFGGLAGANAILLWYRGRQAALWPAVGGVVTRSRVESKKLRMGSTMYRTSGRSTYYRPDLAYSYEVGGGHFEGKRTRFGMSRRWSKDRTRWETLIAPYAVGQTVQVRYDPRKPGESVLEPGVAAFWRGIVWFSVACLGLGVFGWLYG